MAKISVGTTLVPLGDAPLLVQNLGPGTLVVGFSTLTTATDGLEIPAGKALAIANVGAGTLRGISVGACDVRTLAGGLGVSAVASA